MQKENSKEDFFREEPIPLVVYNNETRCKF